MSSFKVRPFRVLHWLEETSQATLVHLGSNSEVLYKRHEWCNSRPLVLLLRVCGSGFLPMAWVRSIKNTRSDHGHLEAEGCDRGVWLNEVWQIPLACRMVCRRDESSDFHDCCLFEGWALSFFVLGKDTRLNYKRYDESRRSTFVSRRWLRSEF